MLNLFATIKEYNKDTDVKFIRDWQITIKSVLNVWNFLKEKRNFLCTRCLNQNCLIGTIQQQGESTHNPRPIQFRRIFKKLFCLNYFEHVERFNCNDDLDAIFSSTDTLSNNFRVTAEGKPTFQSIFFRIEQPDYYNLFSPVENAVTYVTAYFLKQHYCEAYCEYFHENEELTAVSIYISFRVSESETNNVF